MIQSSACAITLCFFDPVLPAENVTRNRKKVDEKGQKSSTDGTFTPIRYVSVAVSCRPVPGLPTRNRQSFGDSIPITRDSRL
jgi:hypothetical protein